MLLLRGDEIGEIGEIGGDGSVISPLTALVRCERDLVEADEADAAGRATTREGAASALCKQSGDLLTRATKEAILRAITGAGTAVCVCPEDPKTWAALMTAAAELLATTTHSGTTSESAADVADVAACSVSVGGGVTYPTESGSSTERVTSGVVSRVSAAAESTFAAMAMGQAWGVTLARGAVAAALESVYTYYMKSGSGADRSLVLKAVLAVARAGLLLAIPEAVGLYVRLLAHGSSSALLVNHPSLRHLCAAGLVVRIMAFGQSGWQGGPRGLRDLAGPVVSYEELMSTLGDLRRTVNE